MRSAASLLSDAWKFGELHAKEKIGPCCEVDAGPAVGCVFAGGSTWPWCPRCAGVSQMKTCFEGHRLHTA